MRHSMVNGFEIKIMVKSHAIEIIFKSSGPFRINQLISTANPGPIWVELGWIGCTEYLVDPKRPSGFKINFKGMAFHHHFYVNMHNKLSTAGVSKMVSMNKLIFSVINLD